MKTFIFTLLISVFALTAGHSQNQSVLYANATGGSGFCDGRAICTDNLGDVITGGTIAGSVVFGSYTVAGTAGYISKANSSGVVQWVTQIPTNTHCAVTSIAVDGLGDIYASGEYLGTCTFGSQMITSALYSSFVCKLNSAGAIVWVKENESDTPSWMKVAGDPNGGVFAVGSFSNSWDMDASTLSSNGDFDVFVARISSVGALTWVKQIGGTGEDFSGGISVAPNGNVYAAGSFESAVNFGSFTKFAIGQSDIFICELDGAGNFKKTETYGGSDLEYINDMELNQSSLYLTGSFDGNLSLGSTNLACNDNVSDCFVFRVDTSLTNVAWASQYGTPPGDNAPYNDHLVYAIAVDNASNAYVTGYLMGTLQFGSNSANKLVSIQPTSGTWDMYIAKFNALGNFAWAKKLGGLGSEDGYDITTDNASAVYGTGTFNSATAVIDSKSMSTANRSAFTIKIAADPFVGMPDALSISDIRIYPVPARNKLTVDSRVNLLGISLYDMSGKELIMKSKRTNEIDVSYLDDGIYFLEIKSAKGVEYVKFIKE